MDEGRTVRVLKALADERRFRMVQTIARAGELSCGALGAHFDIAQPTTHVSAGEPFAVPLVAGALVWAGIYLRDQRLHALLPVR